MMNSSFMRPKKASVQDVFRRVRFYGPLIENIVRGRQSCNERTRKKSRKKWHVVLPFLERSFLQDVSGKVKN